MNGEISFDLVMEEDMDWVEGTYRIEDRDWQVFIFLEKPVSKVEVREYVWRSGVTGVTVMCPEPANLNVEIVKRTLSEALGVDAWVEVRGPDSINIR